MGVKSDTRVCERAPERTGGPFPLGGGGGGGAHGTKAGTAVYTAIGARAAGTEMETQAAALWLTQALLVLPVVYVVVRTHREWTQKWWVDLRVPGTPSVPWLLGLKWFLYAGSGGLALPLLLWTGGGGSGVWHSLLVLPPLSAALLYLVWPVVLLVAHARGFALLLALLQLGLSLATQALLLAAGHSLAATLVWVPTSLWALYALVVAVLAWNRRSMHAPVRPPL